MEWNKIHFCINNLNITRFFFYKSEKNDTMEKSESSIPGFENFPGRLAKVKTGYSYLEGRRQVDGAEDLWRIENNLYDLEGFAKFHPGGAEWIRLTKGTDITELFQV